uniref:Integration host factor subunit alpha n=1 Tax=mine drainage metagenome TaxID=410659 RepID=E6Q8T8_9ZZZZ
MTITRLDLTRHLSDTVGLTAKDCAALVDTFFDALRATLAAGENVKLSGFGNFTLHEKRARPGRNPKTKEPVEIGARRVVTFQASRLVKERCEEGRVLPPFGKARALAGD